MSNNNDIFGDFLLETEKAVNDIPQQEKEEIAAKEPEKPQEPAVEEPVLSPQEQKIVEDFAAKIDIENTNQILQYGAGTQKKMADFSADTY